MVRSTIIKASSASPNYGSTLNPINLDSASGAHAGHDVRLATRIETMTRRSCLQEERRGAGRLPVKAVPVMLVLAHVGRRHDGYSIGVGHTNVDWGTAGGQFTESVVGEQRQVRLTGTVVNHAQYTL